MASEGAKRCVVALKRACMSIDEFENDELVLEPSVLKMLDKQISEAKCSNPLDSSQSSSESSSESSSSELSSSCPASPVPVPSPIQTISADTTILVEAVSVNTEETAGNITNSRLDSPQPGPSCYEDITFESAITSTPQQNCDEGAGAIDDECEMSGINVQDIKNEMRDGKMLIAQVEFEFLRDIRQTVKKNSTKFITKLGEQRIKISKKMALLRMQ